VLKLEGYLEYYSKGNLLLLISSNFTLSIFVTINRYKLKEKELSSS